jgi:hypothetical protein
VLLLIALGVASYVAVAVPLAVVIGRSIKAGLGETRQVRRAAIPSHTGLRTGTG